jgi:hypothetical protein
MATITTKYEVGARVWVADWQSLAEQYECPDCKGRKTWAVTTPAGEEFQIECHTCRRGYRGSSGFLERYVRRVTPWEGTVGSIRVNTAGDRVVEYMLEETGVGSGRLWPEEKLCATVEDAERIARAEIVALDQEERERAEHDKKDILYVRKRAERLRDELARVIKLVCEAGGPVPDKLAARAERVLKRNAEFTDR